jgi:hypothetical protein
MSAHPPRKDEGGPERGTKAFATVAGESIR